MRSGQPAAAFPLRPPGLSGAHPGAVAVLHGARVAAGAHVKERQQASMEDWIRGVSQTLETQSTYDLLTAQKYVVGVTTNLTLVSGPQQLVHLLHCSSQIMANMAFCYCLYHSGAENGGFCQGVFKQKEQFDPMIPLIACSSRGVYFLYVRQCKSESRKCSLLLDYNGMNSRYMIKV